MVGAAPGMRRAGPGVEAKTLSANPGPWKALGGPHVNQDNVTASGKRLLNLRDLGILADF